MQSISFTLPRFIYAIALASIITFIPIAHLNQTMQHWNSTGSGSDLVLARTSFPGPRGRYRSPYCSAACSNVAGFDLVNQPSATKLAAATKASRPEADIRAVLDAQVTAWNAGKLEDFMIGYWNSPELTFFSGGRKLVGWDATLERYRKTYQAEGREMGKLKFSELDITMLGRDAAVVRGRWELTLSDGKKPGGLYTLLFRRFKDGWKIIHDHTSSNQ